MRINTAALLTMSLYVAATGADAFGKPPDFSGVWMPDDGSSTNWSPQSIPFTPDGAAKFRAFDPRTGDSARYCMPYGTPRNTLGTAPRAIEILQKPGQLTMLFDGLNDVRRIYLDGRAHPEDVLPTWMGHSVGRWDGKALRIETVAMNRESILDWSGMPHGEQMIVSERLRVEIKDGQKTLIDEITITDPIFYKTPLKAVRYFRWAPHTNLSEGSSLCLLDQWRQYLERYGKEASAQGKPSADKK